MKMPENNKEINRSGDLTETMFGISGKDSAHILTILRDKLYSNKILAVVREYCTNAQDAHRDAGVTKPIFVTLPNNLNSSFKVRDYGCGLSEEDIRNVYVMYGASTKRQSNLCVGQLGLGCKAAFAYTDKFNITSWQNGLKKVYCAYIDETGIGKIALLTTHSSDEADGIEVQIPVKIDDYYTFKSEAEALLRFFNPIPNISGTTIEEPTYVIKDKLPIPDKNIKFGIYSFNGMQQSALNFTCVVMGGVPYKISRRDIESILEIKNNYYTADILYNFFSLVVHLFVEIGDVDVAAHRESLEYTDKTKEALRYYFNTAAKKAIEIQSNVISKSKTYKEANEHCVSLKGGSSFWNGIINKDTKWNGKKLDGMIVSNIDSDKLPKDIFTIWRARRKENGYNWHMESCIHVDNPEEIKTNAAIEKKLFITDDIKGWKSKIGQWISYRGYAPSSVFVIEVIVDDNKEWEKYYADRYLDDYKITPISKCIVPKEYLDKLKSEKSKSVGYRSLSHIGNIFELKDKAHRRLTTVKSHDWKKINDVPNTKKQYVVLDRFFILSDTNKEMVLAEFENILKVVKPLGFNVDKIYGVKRSQVDKLDSSWISLIPEIKAFIKKTDLLQKLKDIETFEKEVPANLFSYIGLDIKFPNNSVAEKLMKETIRVKKSVESIIHTKNTTKKAINSLSMLGEMETFKSTFSLKSLVKNAKDTYPMTGKLGIFPGKYSAYNNSIYLLAKCVNPDTKVAELAPEVLEYVKLIGK